MFPLTEIPDPKNPDRPRIINPANIDQIIPETDGCLTICFHGGSTYTIMDKETAEQTYQVFRNQIAMQGAIVEAQMQKMTSRLVTG